MYAAKLMMKNKSLNYVDSGLIKKVEGDAFGSAIRISDIKSGLKGFTYCGTVPVEASKTVVSVMPYALDIYIYSSLKIAWRNFTNNAAVTSLVTLSEDKQPYIAATLYYPTTSTQEISFDFEGEKVKTSTVSVPSSFDYASVRVGTGVESIELGLVYNRVLTAEELAQNYQAFLAKHR